MIMRMISKPLIVAAAVLIVWKPRVGLDHALQPAVVCLDDVVQVFRRSMFCTPGQLAFPLQPLIALG